MNNYNNKNDDNDFGLSSQQFQPVSFTQAFGGDDNDNTDNRDNSNLSGQQNRQHLGGGSTTHGTNNSNSNSTMGGGATSNTNSVGVDDDGGDKRVGHQLIEKHVLGVSIRQKGNPVLHHIRNVPFQYFDIVPDYIMSATTCALFLSLKYHRLFPEYIHRRLGELRTDFKLRVLLVLVDVSDNADLILNLNKIGVVNNLTVVLAWSEAEAGRYLETYKTLDGKDASSIQKRESNHIVDQMQDFWTACKPVNKTDAANLWEHFGNLKNVVKASRDEWALVSGLGPVKIQRLYDALHKPFSSRATNKRKREREEKAEAEAKAEEKAKKTVEDDQDHDQEEVFDNPEHSNKEKQAQEKGTKNLKKTT
jgi:DNA excision repair protein ERCC-1